MNSLWSEGWNFEHTYSELPEIFYSSQKLAAVPAPQMVIFNQRLAHTLGLNVDILQTAGDIFSGASLPDGAKPISQAYGGTNAELLDLMYKNKLDYTTTFSSQFNVPELGYWRKKWISRVEDFDMMKKNNPAVIPRNHHVEDALALAEQGDLTLLHNLLNALSNPYEESEVYSPVPGTLSDGYCTFCGT